MKLYLLDTDHASLLQRGNPHVAARIAMLSYHEVAVTTGRLRVIRRASTNDELVRGYSGLDTTIDFFKKLQRPGGLTVQKKRQRRRRVFESRQ